MGSGMCNPKIFASLPLLYNSFADHLLPFGIDLGYPSSMSDEAPHWKAVSSAG